jgi:hypothetical protein
VFLLKALLIMPLVDLPSPDPASQDAPLGVDDAAELLCWKDIAEKLGLQFVPEDKRNFAICTAALQDSDRGDRDLECVPAGHWADVEFYAMLLPTLTSETRVQKWFWSQHTMPAAVYGTTPAAADIREMLWDKWPATITAFARPESSDDDFSDDMFDGEEEKTEAIPDLLQDYEGFLASVRQRPFRFTARHFRELLEQQNRAFGTRTLDLFFALFPPSAWTADVSADLIKTATGTPFKWKMMKRIPQEHVQEPQVLSAARQAVKRNFQSDNDLEYVMDMLTAMQPALITRELALYMAAVSHDKPLRSHHWLALLPPHLKEDAAFWVSLTAASPWAACAVPEEFRTPDMVSAARAAAMAKCHLAWMWEEGKQLFGESEAVAAVQAAGGQPPLIGWLPSKQELHSILDTMLGAPHTFKDAVEQIKEELEAVEDDDNLLQYLTFGGDEELSIKVAILMLRAEILLPEGLADNEDFLCEVLARRPSCLLTIREVYLFGDDDDSEDDPELCITERMVDAALGAPEDTWDFRMGFAYTSMLSSIPQQFRTLDRVARATLMDPNSLACSTFDQWSDVLTAAHVQRMEDLLWASSPCEHNPACEIVNLQKIPQHLRTQGLAEALLSRYRYHPPIIYMIPAVLPEEDPQSFNVLALFDTAVLEAIPPVTWRKALALSPFLFLHLPASLKTVALGVHAAEHWSPSSFNPRIVRRFFDSIPPTVWSLRPDLVTQAMCRDASSKQLHMHASLADVLTICSRTSLTKHFLRQAILPAWALKHPLLKATVLKDVDPEVLEEALTAADAIAAGE